ncbi:MAG: hypothetical protein ACR2Q4_10695 [Geminicoccaceae bacterium]
MELSAAMNEMPTGKAMLQDIQVSDGDVKLLAEIGLSAAVRGSGDAARPIFEALAAIRPDNPIAAIGRALGEISAGRPQQAIAGLRRSGAIANADDGPEEVQAILLIALCLSGEQTDAARLCKRLLDQGSGPSRKIAHRMKSVIDASLPSPASAH